MKSEKTLRIIVRGRRGCYDLAALLSLLAAVRQSSPEPPMLTLFRTGERRNGAWISTKSRSGRNLT